MTNCFELNSLITLSEAWSLDEALWILWVYRCEHDEVCWEGFWTTPYEIGMVEDELCPAMSVKVKFLGGPDGTTSYQGNFSMFAIDRVLTYWRQNGIGWAWLLKFNPDTETHIRNQLGRIKPDFREQKLLPGFEDERDGHWEPSYESGERITDYVQIGDKLWPILESGRQGCKGFSIRAVKSSAGSDDTFSNGRVNVCERAR